ncbi:MAG: hypothetical protein HZT43_08975 [Exiguobacterium profundum]|nr:MAG: hypothetical protein HZT43_08975 [Exiguobacterium profundum]
MAVKTGTGLPELLEGTADADLLTAYGGNDTVYGFDGDDSCTAVRATT